jgi:hypothetical protein
MDSIDLKIIKSTERSSNGHLSFRELESKIFKEEIKDGVDIRNNIIKLAKIVKEKSKR